MTGIPDATLDKWLLDTPGRGDMQRLIAAYRESQAENERLHDGLTEAHREWAEQLARAEQAEADRDEWSKTAHGLLADLAALRAGIEDLQSVLRRAATTAQTQGKHNRPLLDMLALTERLLSTSTDRADGEAS